MLTQTAVRNASWKKATIGNAPSPATKPAADSLEMMGAQMSFSRNEEIYGEGEAADYIYRVVSGAVRTYKVLADGRRQVGGFYMPGDMFGIEPGNEHTFSAEAIARGPGRHFA
jgi:CRP/FNR family transcriptional regulator, nitrogen fixation regulation protein